MINLVLISAVIFCIVMFFMKNKRINNIFLVLYSIIHILTGLFYFTKPSLLMNNVYFSLNNTNIVFYLVLSIVYIAVAIYNCGYVKNLQYSNTKMMHYSLMTLIFVLSMTSGILSQNLALAWIFIEGTTLASAYLIYFNKTKHSIEAAWKYVYICSIGISLAFIGVILLTIATGNLNSLNYSDLILNATTFDKFWLNISFVFILLGFGTKMGLAPVHFWLPDAHAEAPSPISALLSATLLNCAFLVIYNVYKIMVIADTLVFANIMLLTMGFISLFVTAVFIFHIKNYKRMLAYSSIENMGIIAIATAFGGVAYYAMLLHLIGHSLIKASFFLTSGNILEIFETKKIKFIKALNLVDKKTSCLWVASFIGICAFPPSVLFISEFFIVKEMIIQKEFLLCLLFLLLLTIILFGIGKAVLNMVYGELSNDKFELVVKNKFKISTCMYVPQAVLLILAFSLGLYMPKFVDILIRQTLIG